MIFYIFLILEYYSFYSPLFSIFSPLMLPFWRNLQNGVLIVKRSDVCYFGCYSFERFRDSISECSVIFERQVVLIIVLYGKSGTTCVVPPDFHGFPGFSIYFFFPVFRVFRCLRSASGPRYTSGPR